MNTNLDIKMWYVLSTPDPNNPEQEEIWECPANWIKSNILHYPDNSKKSRQSLLNLVKGCVEPESDWITTNNFKHISTLEGISQFSKSTYSFMPKY